MGLTVWDLIITTWPSDSYKVRLLLEGKDSLNGRGVGLIWGFPKIRGTLSGGPYNKDYSILGSILGSPHFGKLP